MIKNKELFSDLDEGFLADVCNANSSRSEIRGRRTVRCFVKDNTGRSCLLELKDAFWVPSYARNLVLVKRLTAMIQFNDDATIKMPNGTVVPKMTNDELFCVRAQPVETGSLAIMSHSVKHWHRVMGHNNWHDVAKLKQEVVGKNLSGSEKKTNCNICCTEKAKRASIPKTQGTRAKTKLAIVHTDVLGPIQQESHLSFCYAVVFFDSYSCFGAVYPLKSKDEVTAKLQRFIIDVGWPGTLVSEGALEFKSKQFSDLCTSNGIKQEFSVPYTPEENTKIERAWGTVTGMTRCTMATAGVPKQFWPFALSTAIYLKNRSIHSAHGKTPFEMFHGSKPDISHLHVFGCQSFVLNEVRKKLDIKAREANLLGYSGNSKANVVALTDGSETRAPKVWVSRNVNFNNDVFPYQRGFAVTQQESEDNDASQSDDDDLKSVSYEQCEATSTKTHAIQGKSEDNHNPDEGTHHVTDSTTAVQQTTTRYSGRTRRAPQHFGDYVTGKELENLVLHCDALISSSLPSNTTGALADPNWKAAMDREIKSLEENGVWELIKPPSGQGQGIISGKWHFAHKLDDEGNVVKYKARFVVRGFTQTPGIDFHDTYSLTAKLPTLRTVLACGVKLGMHFNQMDINTAYLNALIQGDICMEQPEGYQKGKQMVCKIKRSLYGLKQSGRNWFECLSSHLFELNIKASLHDPCLLTLTRNGQKCWIVIWVDDIL